MAAVPQEAEDKHQSFLEQADHTEVLVLPAQTMPFAKHNKVH